MIVAEYYVSAHGCFGLIRSPTANIKQRIHAETFGELVPAVLPLLKEQMRLGSTGVVNH